MRDHDDDGDDQEDDENRDLECAEIVTVIGVVAEGFGTRCSRDSQGSAHPTHERDGCALCYPSVVFDEI